MADIEDLIKVCPKCSASLTFERRYQKQERGEDHPQNYIKTGVRDGFADCPNCSYWLEFEEFIGYD